MTETRAACLVGATGGIGAAVARRLAADAHRPLLLMDLPGAPLDQLAGELDANPLALDLADPDSVAAAFAEARRTVPTLHALVVTSGVVDTAKLATLGLEQWSRVIAVNLTGTFLCLSAARDWLVDGGRVVTLGSLAGRTGGVLTGSAYAASKGGVEALTKSAAQELAARAITVNCVAPGAVETPMLAAHSPESKAGMSAATPLRRMARPEEIAAAVAYLLSDEAGFVTGTVLPVNGGLRMD